MPAGPRPRREPTDDWEQLRLLVSSPEQETYELLRPIVLFGQPARARAPETGVAGAHPAPQGRPLRGRSGCAASSSRTLAGRRRIAGGCRSAIRQAIVELKAEYPPFSLREIARICQHRFDRPVSYHTVEQVLATEPLPLHPPRRLPPLPRHPRSGRTAQGDRRPLPGGLERRRRSPAIWRPRAPRIYETLRRWVDGGLAGLGRPLPGPAPPGAQGRPEGDGGHPPAAGQPRAGRVPHPRRAGAAGHPPLPAHLRPHPGPAPGAGRAAAGGGACPTTRSRCRSPRSGGTSTGRSMSATSRTTQLGTGKPVYVISILENFSRALLASAISPRQDLTAYLIVLRAAVEAHGAPEVLVSDSGGIFKANHAKAIYAALGIAEAADRPGTSLAELTSRPTSTSCAAWPITTTPRRRAGRSCRPCTTASSTTTTTKPHFAHESGPRAGAVRPRCSAGSRGPGATRPTSTASSACGPRACSTPHGSVRFRHWRLYGERGLAGERAAVWVWDETLTIEYADRDPGPVPGGRRGRRAPAAGGRRPALLPDRPRLAAAVPRPVRRNRLAPGTAAGALPATAETHLCGTASPTLRAGACGIQRLTPVPRCR